MKKIHDIWEKIVKSDYREFLIVISLFVFNLILVYSRLTLSINELNAFDGVKYIESGRLLFTWGLRELAWAPLVAFIYAPVHLFVGSSQDWFLIEAWIGNFIMFALIWFSFYYLARQIKYSYAPYIMIGLMIILNPIFWILHNQSDAVFLSLSTFALANFLKFESTKAMKYLWFSSIFVALGVLARVETIILIATLLILGTALNFRKIKFTRILIACTLPLILIITIFILVNLITFGNPALGISEKSYAAFIPDQSVLIYSNLSQVYDSSGQLFGTAEENQGSVIKAIVGHPGIVLKRLAINAINLPKSYLTLFGRVHGWLILLFSGWGILSLIREKQKSTLLVLSMWPLHAFVVLFFVALHFIPQTIYVFYIMATIGICSFFGTKTDIKSKIVLLLIVLATLIFAIVDNRGNLIIGSGLLCLTLLIDILLGSKNLLNNKLRIAPLILLICVGLVIRSSYEFPIRSIGQTDLEKAIHYMEATLPVQSNVISYMPLQTIPARMNYVDIKDVSQFSEDPDLFMDFIREHHIRAIFLDDIYVVTEQQTAIDLIEANASEFILGYQSDNQNLRIYLVREESPVETK